MGALKFFILAVFGVSGVSLKTLPLDELKCKLQDPVCMKSSVQKAVPLIMDGMPEIGIEVLDVMEVDPIRFELSGLKFTLTDGRLKGLKNAVVDSVNWNLSKKRVDVVYHLNSSLNGHYTANGNILILPITGDGQMKLNLRNIKISLRLNYEEKVVNKKTYFHLTKYTFDFDVKDGANFHLSNLFKGNKELADTMHKFLNDNWKLISNEFGRPMLNAVAEKLYKNVKIFLNHYAISDIGILE